MNYIYILLTVLLNASAQLVLKKGTEVAAEKSNLVNYIISNISNIYYITGFLLYGISVLLWIYVLSKVEVSFAYPFLSIGYIVTTLGGYFYFNEQLNLIKIIGILIICIGVIVLSKS